VIYRPNRFLGAKVRVFIDWTVSLFERHPQLRMARRQQLPAGIGLPMPATATAR